MHAIQYYLAFNVSYLCALILFTFFFFISLQRIPCHGFKFARSKRSQGARAYRSPALLVAPGGGAAEVVDRVSEHVERVPQISQPRPGAGVAALLRLGVRCQTPRLVELPLQPPQVVCGDPAFAREERRHRTRRGLQRRGCDHHGCGDVGTTATGTGSLGGNKRSSRLSRVNARQLES